MGIIFEEITDVNNYSDGKENYEEYFYQQCESDARKYAKLAVQDYQTRIEEYLENK